MELWFPGSKKNLKDDSKVKVEAYVESQCPYCIGFITGALQSVMNLPDIVAIIDLKIVPYGNTKYNSTTDVYTCQHGSKECDTDVLELCVLYRLSGSLDSIISGDTSLTAWPFILCMANAQGTPALGEKCYNDAGMVATGLAWSSVQECSVTESGAVQAAGKTATPADHQYVPWVLVDGELLEDPDTTLLTSICSAYTGSPEPISCVNNRKKMKVSHADW